MEDARSRVAGALEDAVASDGRLLDGARVVGEILAGALLAVVIAFFLVEDGPELQRRSLSMVPEHQQERVNRVAVAAWSTLGRFLMGAGTLGLVEAFIMGATLLLVGSGVALPVAALTFAAAFVPFIGAVVAGIVATLVTLASSGPEGALVVAVVAIVVQQFDNELLAPLIYSRALRMHPLTVIVSVATGAAVGGLLGALAAVPVVAIVQNAYAADRAHKDDACERE